MGSAKSRSIVWCWLPNLTRYSLTVLLSLVMLAESVGATPRNTQLQIAQQSGTPQDANRAAAEKAEQEAEQLSKQKAPLLTQVIPKYEEALKYWRLAKDRKKEAEILNQIALSYFVRGEYPKAVEYAQKALPICQALGDKECEGMATNLLSLSYEKMGEYQKAIVLNLQVPSLFPETSKLLPKVFMRAGRIYGEKLGAKQKALDYYNKALDFWKQKGDVVQQADILTYIGGFYLVSLGEINKSIEIIKQVNTLDPEFKRDTSLYNLFYQGLASSSCTDQLASLKKPPDIEQPKDSSNQSATPNSDAVTNNNIEQWNQLAQKWRKQEIIQAEVSFLELLASLEYQRIGEYPKALEVYQQALKLMQIMGAKPAEAKTLTDIAYIKNKQGKKQEAINFLNQALDIQRQIKDRSAEADTLNTLGDVYLSLGAYPQSLNAYNRALSLSEIIGNRLKKINTLDNIGRFYRDLQDYPQALNYYQQALSISRTTGNCYHEVGSLIRISNNHLNSGDYQQAMKVGNQALDLSRNLEINEDKLIYEANVFHILAKVEIKQGNYSQSLEYAQKARNLALKSGSRDTAANFITATAEAYASLKQPEKAIQAYQEQLAIYGEMGLFPEQAQSLYNIAKLQRQNNQLPAALTEINKAITIIENIRQEVASQDLRTSFFATKQDYYQLTIDILMQLYKKDPSKICEFTTKDPNSNKDITIKDKCNAVALHISERSRARGLIELLTEARADIRKGVDPKLLAEERRLLWKLDALAKRLQELPSNQENQRPALKKEIETLLNQQNELQTKIRTSSPKYYNLQYPEPLKLPQIQQQLDKDTLLLQYSLGEKRSYLWAITPNSVDSYELPGREKIEDKSNVFRQVLVARTATNELTESATELSQQILAPVANKLGKKRLVIVADGALQNIPFAALADLNSQLPSPSKKVEGEVNYQPLLVNHEIVNLPSASTIAILRQEAKGRKVPPKALAILADPVFSAKDPRVTGKPENELGPELDLQNSDLARSAKNLNRDGWNRLEGTRQEAEAILKLVSPKDSLQALNFDANYGWITSPQLSQYRVIHFATHGFADGINPELSGIVLSLVNQQGRPIRGFLRLNDIFNLDFPADLVVLSACETGVGKNVQGEGLVGLTRGLMYAGSQRVLVSLWNVSDEGTSLLMSEFYHQMLKQGKSPIAALRAAQLKLWEQKDWRSPLYWGAFTLQGEWR
ncbi:MAG: CHAT domain-containing tetratricopeptide repeat protein [Gloeotrichia echinulata IR180]